MKLGIPIILTVILDAEFDQYKLFIKNVDKYFSHLFSDDTHVYYTSPDNFSYDLTEYFNVHGISSVYSMERLPDRTVLSQSDCVLIFKNVNSNNNFESIMEVINGLDIKHRIINFNPKTKLEYET